MALIGALVGGAAALLSGVAWYCEPERAARRAARRRPAAPIAEVADGSRVKIVGRIVLAAAPLTAPLTGRACVGYRLEVQALAEGRHPLHVRTQAIRFLVEDERGDGAWVHADGATLLPGPPVEVRVGPAAPPAGAPARLLASLRLPTERVAWALRESRLEVGQRVAVVGRARRALDRSGLTGGPRRAPARLSFDGAGEPLHIVPLG